MSDDKPKAKKGGARPGAGRKKTKIIALDGRSTAGRNCARRVLDAIHAEETYKAMIRLEQRRLGIDETTGQLKPETKDKDGVITGPDYQGKFSIIPLTNLLRYLDDRDLGKCQDNVNHIHNKPIEHNVNVSLSERFRIAIEKANKRAANS